MDKDIIMFMYLIEISNSLKTSLITYSSSLIIQFLDF
jgi:hypothetical protein